jgi:hypothetical protein
MERKNQARMHLMNADCGGEKIQRENGAHKQLSLKNSVASQPALRNLLNKSNQPCEVSAQVGNAGFS